MANSRSKNYRPRNNTKSKGSKSKSRSNMSKVDIMKKEIGEDNIPKVSKPPMSNDPNWYIYDPVMFNGVISMPTLEFKGVKTPWPYTGEFASNKPADAYLGVPTVVAYHMNPSASYTGSDFASSPINIAARKMYAELSASNAKTSQYAPQDVATLILALGQVIAITNHLKRGYGITNYYNFYNRTVPKAMMGAYHTTEPAITSWTKDMAAVRAQLNAIIARINSIHFPGSLNYFRKCEYIYSNVFVDRDDNMPTYQMCVPATTWILDETSYEQGSILKTTEFTTNSSLFSKILILNDMVEAILTSATFNYIFADLINLANRNVISSDWIHIDMLPIDYTIEPLYSEQFNWQMMNATIIGRPDVQVTGYENTPSNDVYPDVDMNCLRYSPTWSISSINTLNVDATLCNYTKDRPIRIPDTNLSDEEFVELLAYYNTFTSTISEYDPETMLLGEAKVLGITDYYLTGIQVWNGNNYLPHTADEITSNVVNTEDSVTVEGGLSKAAKLLNVVHAPILSICSSVSPVEYVLSKLGTFTFTNTRALTNLRNETFLGLFKFN